MTNRYALAESSWGPEEIEAIQKVIASDRYSMGPFVEKFESEFADYFESQYAIMANSGSSANLLAVASLIYRKNNALKAGDEVIVPAISWSTTYTPLHQYGLKLKFVDIDLETLNYDLEQLKTAVTDQTKMIMAVNLLGNPNNFDEIKNIIGEKDILMIEDNCESMGAKISNRFTGTFGILGTFSTFFSHHMSTMEGGVIVTDDKELYHIMLALRSHGWTRNLPQKNLVTNEKSDNEFEEYYKFVLPGYNLRPVEMSGAIGIEQLKKLPEFVKNRRSNALHFQELFHKNENIIIQKELGESSWFGFSIIIKNKSLDRNKLVKFLDESGIENRPIVGGNFVKNEMIKYFDYEVHNSLVNADLADQNGFFVGNHHFDMREQIGRFAKVLNEYIDTTDC